MDGRRMLRAGIGFADEGGRFAGGGRGTVPPMLQLTTHMNTCFRRILSALVPGVIACVVAVGIAQQTALPPLRIAGNMTTIELAPVLLAANGVYRGQVTVVNGGIPNLMRGEVDAAT